MNVNKKKGEFGELLYIQNKTEDIHTKFGYCKSKALVFEEGVIFIYMDGNLAEGYRVMNYKKTNRDCDLTKVETFLKYNKMEMIDWLNEEIYNKEDILAHSI